MTKAMAARTRANARIEKYEGDNKAFSLTFGIVNRVGHIHGELRLKFNGNLVSHMGYGRDDVCFNNWTEELQRAVATLHADERGVYCVDEGEQGQPCFEFRRHGPVLFFSIIDGVIGDGLADPEWQRVPCSDIDFENAASTFLEDFAMEITHL